MKVLARRANGIFIIGPVVIGLCIALWLYIAEISSTNDDAFYASYIRLLIYSGIIFSLTLWHFVQRLFVPKVMIECDDFGLYIYRRRKEDVVLRYEYLESLYAEADVENAFVYVGRRSLFNLSRCRIEFGGALEKIIKTGNLQIRTQEGMIELKGVYHVKTVKEDIDRLVRKRRREKENQNAEFLQYADRETVETYLENKTYR